MPVVNSTPSIGHTSPISEVSSQPCIPLVVKRILLDQRATAPALHSDGTLSLNPLHFSSFTPPAGPVFDDLHEIHFAEAFTTSSPIILKLPTDKDSSFGKKLEIGAGVSIGEGTTISFDYPLKIGESTQIGKNCQISIDGYYGKFIGARVKIGDNCVMNKVSISNDCEIGSEAQIDAPVVEFGEKVKVGSGFIVTSSSSHWNPHLRISNNVAFGNNVRVSLDKSIFIGERAVIESNSEIRGNIERLITLLAVDSPYSPILHVDAEWPEPKSNPHLSDELKKIIGSLAWLEVTPKESWVLRHCTTQAAQALSADPGLLLYSRITSKEEHQIIRIVGQKASVLVFFNYSDRKYFGADEIDPTLVAEERRIPDEMYPRLLAIPRLSKNVKATMIAYNKEIPKDVPDKYGEMSLEEVFMLFEFLRAHLGWSQGKPLKLIDIGSGLAKVLKIAGEHDVFEEVHGVELNPLRHRVALEHLPQGGNIRLFQGDFFEHDLSPYDVVHVYLQFPIRNTGFFDSIPNVSVEFPFAQRFREKLWELKSGAIIIMGPIEVPNWAGVLHTMKNINRQILSNMIPVTLPFPKELEGYGIFRRP